MKHKLSVQIGYPRGRKPIKVKESWKGNNDQTEVQLKLGEEGTTPYSSSETIMQMSIYRTCQIMFSGKWVAWVYRALGSNPRRHLDSNSPQNGNREDDS